MVSALRDRHLYQKSWPIVFHLLWGQTKKTWDCLKNLVGIKQCPHCPNSVLEKILFWTVSAVTTPFWWWKDQVPILRSLKNPTPLHGMPNNSKIVIQPTKGLVQTDNMNIPIYLLNMPMKYVCVCVWVWAFMTSLFVFYGWKMEGCTVNSSTEVPQQDKPGHTIQILTLLMPRGSVVTKLITYWEKKSPLMYNDNPATDESNFRVSFWDRRSGVRPQVLRRAGIKRFIEKNMSGMHYQVTAWWGGRQDCTCLWGQPQGEGGNMFDSVVGVENSRSLLFGVKRWQRISFQSKAAAFLSQVWSVP